MATLTIRNLEDSIKKNLRIQAANHDHSMEEEARRILRQVFMPEEKANRIGSKIHQYFVQAGCVDDNMIPPRSMPRSAPDFTGTDDK